MTLLLLSMAHAALPERDAAVIEALSGADPSALEVFPDQGVAALVDAGNGLLLLDLETWTVGSLATCTDAAGLAGWDDGAGVLQLWMGCGDGTLVRVDWIDGEAGPPTKVELQGQGPVLGVAATADRVWAIVDAESGNTAVAVDPTTSVVDADRSGQVFGRNGFEDCEASSAYVFVAHGDADFSKIDGNTGAISVSADNLSAQLVDVEVLSTVPWFASKSGAVVKGTTDGDLSLAIDDEDGLGDAFALAFSSEQDHLAVAEADRISFFPVSGLTVGDQTEGSLDVGDATILAWAPGYLLASASDGVHVLTDRPWIEISGGAGSFESGDVVALEFVSDTAGDWSLRLGSASGTVIDSGSAEAGVGVSTSATVDDSWVEGDNRLFVVIGEGLDAVDVTVDAAPLAPEGLSAAVGDGRITLSFEALDAEDIASYKVYFSTVAFTADEWPTGGPAYEGDADLESPITIDPGEGTLSVVIEGLTNGVPVYLAVRATDAGAKEGPMSKVVQAVPSLTVGAAELSGEDGLMCGTGGGAAALALAFGGLAALARRRRGAVVAAALLLPAVAKAEPPEEAWVVKSRSTAITMGPIELNDPSNTASNDAWDSVYSGSKQLVNLKLGYQAFRMFEVDGNLGLVRKQGSLLATETGTSSGDDAVMTALPLGVALTFRFDPALPCKAADCPKTGWPLVPYASVGVDSWTFRERLGAIDSTDPFANEVMWGTHMGWHWAVGGQILLDWMDPRGASAAAARWGIEDTYLVVEYRKNTMIADPWDSADSGALSFGGSVFSVGLQVDKHTRPGSWLDTLD